MRQLAGTKTRHGRRAVDLVVTMSREALAAVVLVHKLRPHQGSASLTANCKVAVTLRRDEHLSIDIHLQKQGPVVSGHCIAKTSSLQPTEN